MSRKICVKNICRINGLGWPSLLSLGLILVLLSACGPGDNTGTGWMTFRYDRTHSGHSEETLPIPLTLEWSYQSYR
jgi:hypothetical protein